MILKTYIKSPIIFEYSTLSYFLKNDIDPELIYRKDPLNYTQEHNLTNLIPFLLPNYSAVYMRNANLSDYYDYIDYYSYSKRIIFGFSYLYIGGSVKYNLDGVLEEVTLSSWITGKQEPALWLTRVSIGASGGNSRCSQR